jgi:hypothetical protein
MPRKFPAYVKPYGGSAKFSLTMNNVEYILDFLRKHPDYIKFHDFTLFPDEIFFQTILLNATYNRISNIVADDLCYQDWSEKGAHPTIFRKKDFGTIINSGKLFARKFDSTVDSEILNMIDENIATGIDKVGISGLTFF